MGVYCEINLFKPVDGAFVPGSTVSGIIKYAVDQETVFNKITMSLKGNGQLRITDKRRKKRTGNMSIYRNSEKYIDIENIVHNNDKAPVAIGAYEIPFCFTLPQNLPPSLDYFKSDIRYRIRCNIKYYISMVFERPGLFKLNKKMKKEITVVSGIKPRLPMEPTMLAEQKKLFKPFSRKPNIVNIKANIENCVIAPGGNVRLNYEIFNHTTLNLKGVETKLVETYTFTTQGHRKVKVSKDVEQTDSKSGSIIAGAATSSDLTISLPSEIGSLEYSHLVSRDYFVHIIAEIPFPHLNAYLEVPIQVGDRKESSSDAVDDPPPSYWEAMAEAEKLADDEDDDDEELEAEKS